VLGRGRRARPCSIAASEGDLSGRPVFDRRGAALPGFAKPQEFVF
jgi:hypothetical protein